MTKCIFMVDELEEYKYAYRYGEEWVKRERLPSGVEARRGEVYEL